MVSKVQLVQLVNLVQGIIEFKGSISSKAQLVQLVQGFNLFNASICSRDTLVQRLNRFNGRLVRRLIWFKFSIGSREHLV